MELSDGMKFGLGLFGVVVLLGGIYLVTRQPDPPAPSVVQPYPTPAPAPEQNDVAAAVAAGLGLAGNIVSRVVPDANARLAAERDAENRRLEQERFRACLANPNAPVCQGPLTPRT